MSDYKPPIGGNVPGPEGPPPAIGRYADIDELRRDLETLLTELDALEDVLEDDINNYALLVDRNDTRLLESLEAEWPDELDEPKEYVSYPYYKALGFVRETTTASYIRQRFEEAARDVTGTASFDLLPFVSIARNEALLVREFINVYTDQIDDSSEYRTIEIFQDWVTSALGYTREFWRFVKTRNQTAAEPIPATEVERLTPEESAQGQAVFKLKLNELNREIVQDLDYLKSNFSEHAPIFYKKFLGPALKYRLDVGRKAVPTGSALTMEVERASNTLDTKFRSVLSDQMRRRGIFHQKVGAMFTEIQERDRYREAIKMLSAKGKPIPSSGPGIMVRFEGDGEDWEQHLEGLPKTFRPSHHVLAHRDDDEAHPQYLLKHGGKMTGDIELEEGVLVDGMRPGTHVHTGLDGTKQIHGKDLVDVHEDSIDEDEVPPTPYSLRVLANMPKTQPPGYTVIDSAISFKGHSRYSYEIQMTPLEPVEVPLPVTEVGSLTLQIWDSWDEDYWPANASYGIQRVEQSNDSDYVIVQMTAFTDDYEDIGLHHYLIDVSDPGNPTLVDTIFLTPDVDDEYQDGIEGGDWLREIDWGAGMWSWGENDDVIIMYQIRDHSLEWPDRDFRCVFRVLRVEDGQFVLGSSAISPSNVGWIDDYHTFASNGTNRGVHFIWFGGVASPSDENSWFHNLSKSGLNLTIDEVVSFHAQDLFISPHNVDWGGNAGGMAHVQGDKYLVHVGGDDGEFERASQLLLVDVSDAIRLDGVYTGEDIPSWRSDGSIGMDGVDHHAHMGFRHPWLVGENIRRMSSGDYTLRYFYRTPEEEARWQTLSVAVEDDEIIINEHHHVGVAGPHGGWGGGFYTTNALHRLADDTVFNNTDGYYHWYGNDGKVLVPVETDEDIEVGNYLSRPGDVVNLVSYRTDNLIVGLHGPTEKESPSSGIGYSSYPSTVSVWYAPSPQEDVLGPNESWWGGATFD